MALTLTDVGKFNRDVLTGLIDQAVKATPEVVQLPWKAVTGYTYSTLVKTANPVVAFRDVNEGVSSTNSTYTNNTITCKLLNPRWECDKAVADACIDGAELFIAREAKAQMQGAFYAATRQLYKGTGAHAKGFTGLDSQIDSGCIVYAHGTTNSTATSVYVFAAEDPDNITWVLGGDGAFDLGDVRVESIDDGTGKRYDAYVQSATFWIGAQLGHAKAVVRICNLTEDSGKGLTDNLLYEAMECFPASLRPTHIFMNRRSQGQLRASRTATNMTGAPAPLPQEVEGVPIFVTEALLNTEALESES